MPIKNYTTGEIHGALTRNGARKIMVDYDDQEEKQQDDLRE